ncbi:Zn-finger nucleic acid-binding protein [Aurantimicrobium minutum]|uniref:TFIIB-type zinc ribbon-containing protein n=1 Tax=Aurantimicrobium minutum TaxID=708131 RepID=UPI002475A79D|nr:zf-TFIIB domain-containing protein [Aurantimicrobium minutum]MDH6532945.1 Zn-finger nucleic acid-binding protein [Aurantimicrobium minutum]
MQCPTDGSTLAMSDRSGVEIDYCPQCRGVWLDRGELDKIIERSVTESSGRFGDPSPDRRSRDDHGGPGHGDSGRGGYSSGRGRKKENWLGELFG